MAWASSGHSYLWAKENTITDGGKPAVLGPHKLLSGLLYWCTELLQPRLRCLSLCSNKTYLKWLSYPRQARNAHRHSIQHLLVPDNQKEPNSLQYLVLARLLCAGFRWRGSEASLSRGSGELTFPSSPSPGMSLLLLMTTADDASLGAGFSYLKLEHS